MPRDRYGELLEDQDDHTDPSLQATQRPPHDCQDGWIDPDVDNPLPCLVCRPHLAPDARRAALGLPAVQPAADPQTGINACRAALRGRHLATTGATP